MTSRGMSQIEIAHEPQVSKASISSDMQYLRIDMLTINDDKLTLQKKAEELTEKSK